MITAFIELGKFLLTATSRGFLGQVIAMIILSAITFFSTVQYVNAKHDEVTKKITINSKKVSEFVETQSDMSATLRVLTSTLQNVNDSMKEVKEDTRITRDQVWKILNQQSRR